MDRKGKAIFGFPRLRLSDDFLPAFCKKWHIRELSLFGSVLRDDFRVDSDIDVLVQFDEAAGWGVFDMLDMADELQQNMGRIVHIVEKDGLRNPFRRDEILRTREVVYAG